MRPEQHPRVVPVVAPREGYVELIPGNGQEHLREQMTQPMTRDILSRDNVENRANILMNHGLYKDRTVDDYLVRTNNEKDPLTVDPYNKDNVVANINNDMAELYDPVKLINTLSPKHVKRYAKPTHVQAGT
jgi:hypothetical protein